MAPPARRSVLAVIATIMALVLAACGSDDAAPEEAAFDESLSQELPTAPVVGQRVGDVSLPDVANGGEPFPFTADEGEALVVYFGFTACPDICPTTLFDLKRALEEMGADAERVDVAMVTIDPERDVDATIRAYLQSFVPDGHPLRTTDQDRLQAAVDAFGGSYEIIRSADDVEVLHSAYLYAVDDEGVIRIVWPFGAEPDRIRADLGDLLSTT